MAEKRLLGLSARGEGGLVFSPFFWYMGGHFCWFVISGIQMVLIPAIGLLVLEISPRQLGLAQMAAMLPTMLFMLLGGLLAERRDARLVLSGMQLAALVPPMILGLSFLGDFLSYEIYLLSGFGLGLLMAFILPARDSLLNRIAGGEIQRSVTFAVALQFTGMLTGIALVSLSVYGGFLPFIMIQCLMSVACSYAAYRLPSRAVFRRGARGGAWSEIASGLRMAWRMKDILAVLLLMSSVGVFYIGTFIVILPLMTSMMYQGTAAHLSLIQVLFWTGTILITVAMTRLGVIVRRGRALSFAIFTGAGVLVVFSFWPPFWLFCACVFVWGLGAGISMSLTRTTVQEEAPESHRARLLSIYNLSFMGGAPIGAYVMGELAQNMALERVVLFPAIGMVMWMVFLLWRTPLWRLRSGDGAVGVSVHS